MEGLGFLIIIGLIVQFGIIRYAVKFGVMDAMLELERLKKEKDIRAQDQ